MRRILAFPLQFCLVACVDPLEPVACLAEDGPEPAFRITVFDSINGNNLAPAATVRVRDGSFSATLRAITEASTPYYGGAVWDRPGKYDVTITHPSYFPWTQRAVVNQGACYLITTSLTARLRPR